VSGAALIIHHFAEFTRSRRFRNRRAAGNSAKTGKDDM
jgi:hypothetical protein